MNTEPQSNASSVQIRPMPSSTQCVAEQFLCAPCSRLLMALRGACLCMPLSVERA